MSASVYVMQPIGQSYASNPPRGQPSDALKVLYFMRRHGQKCTNEQIESFVIPDKWQAQRVMRDLMEMNAIQKIA